MAAIQHANAAATTKTNMMFTTKVFLPLDVPLELALLEFPVFPFPPPLHGPLAGHVGHVPPVWHGTTVGIDGQGVFGAGLKGPAFGAVNVYDVSLGQGVVVVLKLNAALYTPYPIASDKTYGTTIKAEVITVVCVSEPLEGALQKFKFFDTVSVGATNVLTLYVEPGTNPENKSANVLCCVVTTWYAAGPNVVTSD